MNNLHRIAANMRANATRARVAGAGRVATRWSRTTRRRSGEHAESVHVEERGPDATAVVADSDHSVYVELGTWKMRGDHAGANALELEAPAIVELYAEAILRG